MFVAVWFSARHLLLVRAVQDDSVCINHNNKLTNNRDEITESDVLYDDIVPVIQNTNKRRKIFLYSTTDTNEKLSITANTTLNTNKSSTDYLTQ